ncbi:ATPase [Deinococcus detaillensis]|uniref:ATPase n=1 Tax=Deinococcus detaillensis TaxID=2592048 RepID=A0A553V4V5_9DEIO|nr:BadF/BadG/BcrA/BcrD ATPase family protein [Deinococcus detaillensis]TSA87486.1 ATPase [Deinococcus detaillensis]
MSGPPTLLSLDLGASSSKWALYAGEEFLAEGKAVPLSGHLYTPEARQQMVEGLAGIRAEVQSQPAALVAGVTGLQGEYAPMIAELLSRTFGLPPAAIYVTDDLHLAYSAHFAASSGTLVYAGTGSMAYHRTAREDVIRAGGHGFLIDDAGGAFWQGRQGLKVALRQADEGQPEGPLAAALYAAIGSQHWPDIRAHVYAGGRAAVARLAPAVYAAALGNDPEAQAIQRRAGEELARLGRIVSRQVGNDEVAAAGGAFNPLVKRAFVNHVGAQLQLVPSISPLLGGPALARSLGLFAPSLQGVQP